MSVKDNVAASTAADGVFAVFVCDTVYPIDCPRYWERLIELCTEKLPPKKEMKIVNPAEKKLMNDIAARAFEKTIIPFGEYKLSYVGEVRPDYLEWLASENDFITDLRRYVGSKHFKKKSK